jgi:hypothetical protein
MNAPALVTVAFVEPRFNFVPAVLTEIVEVSG